MIRKSNKMYWNAMAMLKNSKGLEVCVMHILK